MRTSYSAINTFTTCPLKYKYQYVEKRSAPKGEAAVFGSLIHSCLHYFHKTSPIPTSEELVNFYSRHWKSTIYDDSRLEQERFSGGIELLKRYYEATSSRMVQPLALEMAFQVPICQASQQKDDPLILTGIIDRIDKLPDGRFEIIDYKTGKTLPSQQTVDNDLQLSVYWMAVRERWPNRDMTGTLVSLYFLKHGEKIQSRRTIEQIDQTKNAILQTVNSIKSEEFSPSPSALCDYCEFREICPMMRHKYREKREAQHEEEIADTVQEYIRLKDEEKRIRLQLKKLSSELLELCHDQDLGRLFGPENDFSVMLTKRESYGYDMEKLREILEASGRWEEVLKIDLMALRRLIPELPSNTQKKINTIRHVEKTVESLTVKRK